MLLSEIKQGLINKFFKETRDGVSLLELNSLLINTSFLLSESAKSQALSLLEADALKPNETSNVSKAFDNFTNGTFNTIIAIDESDVVPKILYIAVKEYRKCSHINCMEGSLIPTLTTPGYIRKALQELKELNEEIKFSIGHK